MSCQEMPVFDWLNTAPSPFVTYSPSHTHLLCVTSRSWWSDFEPCLTGPLWEQPLHSCLFRRAVLITSAGEEVSASRDYAQFPQPGSFGLVPSHCRKSSDSTKWAGGGKRNAGNLNLLFSLPGSAWSFFTCMLYIFIFLLSSSACTP